jgi:hypothetical protein
MHSGSARRRLLKDGELVEGRIPSLRRQGESAVPFFVDGVTPKLVAFWSKLPTRPIPSLARRPEDDIVTDDGGRRMPVNNYLGSI